MSERLRSAFRDYDVQGASQHAAERRAGQPPPPRWIITMPGTRTPRVARSAFVVSIVSRSTCSGCTNIDEVCVQSLGAANVIQSAAAANCMTSSPSPPTTSRDEVTTAGDEAVYRLRRAAIGSQPSRSSCERSVEQKSRAGIQRPGQRGSVARRYVFYLSRSLQADFVRNHNQHLLAHPARSQCPSPPPISRRF